MAAQRLKRVLALHDISCFGKCSLTVALPIISACGHECTVMPDALLSAHTAVPGYTYLDLTDQIKPVFAHWHDLKLRFDSIYTGFLCNEEQIDIACDIVDTMGDDPVIVVVDPAMADNGQLYPTFDEGFPVHMKELCARADIFKPNITEACLLLGREYEEGPYTEEWIDGLMMDLTRLGARRTVLTGVYFDEKSIGAATYDSDTGEIEYIMNDKVPGIYHGTGDIFCSVVVGAMNRGKSFNDSVRIAVDFTQESILRTYHAGTDVRFGVDFESGLPELIRRVRE